MPFIGITYHNQQRSVRMVDFFDSVFISTMLLACALFFLSRCLWVYKWTNVLLVKYVYPFFLFSVAAYLTIVYFPIDQSMGLSQALLMFFLGGVVGVAAHFVFSIQPKYSWSEKDTWVEVMNNTLNVSDSIKLKLAQSWLLATNQTNEEPTITHKEYGQLVAALASHMFEIEQQGYRVARSELGVLRIFPAVF